MKKLFNSEFKKAYEIKKQIKKVIISKNKYNVLKNGLINDGKFDNYQTLKHLIEKCNNENGGQLIFPKGIYFIDGPIVLLSNIHLKLKRGAILSFGTNELKYLVNKNREDGCALVNFEGTTVYNFYPNIYAYKVNNISITGQGSITANGTNVQFKWRGLQKADLQLSRQMNNDNTPLEERIFGKNHYLRYDLIGIYESSQILIEGVSISDCGFWLIHPVLSNNITIKKVKYNAFNLNNDGIEPESCKHVLIEKCRFGNGDDNIAIKSFRDLEGINRNVCTENVFIRKCSFNGLNAVSIGSEISGGVKNIYVENCKYHGDISRALHIKTNRDRGGTTENIYIRNMKFGNVVEGVSIIMNYKNENKYNRLPAIKNINIGNVKFKNVKDNLVVLKGLPESKITDIILVNIKSDNDKIINENTNNLEIR